MLGLADVNCYYGGVHVLKDVSLEVGAGEILALLGRNGAGKTTTLKAIMGLVEVRSGRIRFAGEELTRHPPHDIARYGIGYVPQGRGLFPSLSVEENLRMGLLVGNAGPETLDWVMDLFPMLKPRLRQRAGTLSGGQQQMVATARALCVRPTLLLLDEPSEGLMPTLVETLMGTIRRLKAHQVSVLLVEQKIDSALRVADRIALLDDGMVRHEASPQELTRDPEPLQRYVGVKR